jgi:ubiquinone/menaquinone biosynthesis C-methylase UbiE
MTVLRRESERVNRMRDMAPAEVSHTYADLMGMASSQYDSATRSVARHCPDARSVLDVGTGPGFLPPRLARAYPSASVVGIDTSGAMLSIARQRSAAAGVADRVTFAKGSAYAIPFSDATFDLVVATNAIHGFNDLTGFVREARRVLHSGGHLVVLDLRRDVLWPIYALMWGTTFTLRALRKPIDGMGPVIDACYTRSEVEAALADAGFEQQRVRTGLVRLEAWAQA